ncbi:hypothetical protein [Seonamhaeicola maritimus]|uniref:Uncharacterized protein n=1 Tax=Seonamhaeicola maritimus TaxID=2591822 RepID=A0A5C7GMH4_9FLAO|nr:hypothetical protein [Seonamhaeicola maritimus]TXG39475.1 hypothetical protein FUA22_06285 [Seonamhaeicola maritimus]
MKQLIIVLFGLGFCAPCFGQIHDEKFRLAVLMHNVKEQSFVFGEWEANTNNTETHLNYLGEIKTNDNEEYRIMTSSWFWGPTKKVTNQILVFDQSYNLIGNYYLNTKCELPTKIDDNKLIFKPAECTDCDYAITKVDFYEGIPKNFYLGCKPGLGNIYSFYLCF